MKGWRNFGFTLPRYFWIWSRRGCLKRVAVRDQARCYALSDVVGEGLRALVLVVDAVERFRVLGLGLHAGNASASKGFVTAGRWLPRVRFVVRLARNFTRRSIDRFCAAISLFASRRMLRGMSLMSFRAST